MNNKLAPLALLFCAFAAHAQTTTYLYQGQPYDDKGDAISGFIELPDPIAPNSTVTITPVQSFTMAATDTRLSAPGSEFYLTTDSNGNIISWSFFGELDWACSCVTSFTSSNTAFDNVSISKYPDPPDSYGTSTKPGTWTRFDGPATAALQGELAQDQQQINTLTAQLSSTQAQSTAANARIAALNAEVNTLSIQRASYLHGYLVEYGIIQRLNAVIMKCRATGGKC